MHGGHLELQSLLSLGFSPAQCVARCEQNIRADVAAHRRRMTGTVGGGISAVCAKGAGLLFCDAGRRVFCLVTSPGTNKKLQDS